MTYRWNRRLAAKLFLYQSIFEANMIYDQRLRELIAELPDMDLDDVHEVCKVVKIAYRKGYQDGNEGH